MNSYAHNSRQSEGKEHLQAALFDICKPVGRSRELGGMKWVPYRV